MTACTLAGYFSGRSTQEDPIGLAGGLNLYGYGNGDPLNNSDPFGLCPVGVAAVSARGEGRSVIVLCADGTEDVRSGGTRAWRNNNPGNIRGGGFANRNGAIGEAGGFAVFSTEADGQSALLTLLRSAGYQDLTVAGAIARYAPPAENDTKAYQESVTKQTGIQHDRRMDGLSDDELESVAKAIRRHEGWTEGTVINRPAQPTPLPAPRRQP